jgi:hypothetical protein
LELMLGTKSPKGIMTEHEFRKYKPQIRQN